MRVLIIDDEEEICLLLKHQFERIGITTETAHTIKQGVKLFHENAYDAVFLDINLPDGNGLSIIDDLKQANSELKIIVSSAYTSESDQKRLTQSDVYKFLPKPFSKENVLNLISI